MCASIFCLRRCDVWVSVGVRGWGLGVRVRVRCDVISTLELCVLNRGNSVCGGEASFGSNPEVTRFSLHVFPLFF